MTVQNPKLQSCLKMLWKWIQVMSWVKTWNLKWWAEYLCCPTWKQVCLWQGDMISAKSVLRTYARLPLRAPGQRQVSVPWKLIDRKMLGPKSVQTSRLTWWWSGLNRLCKTLLPPPFNENTSPLARPLGPRITFQIGLSLPMGEWTHLGRDSRHQQSHGCWWLHKIINFIYLRGCQCLGSPSNGLPVWRAAD